MENNLEKEPRDKSLIIISGFAFLFVIGSWLITWCTLVNKTERGTFGDMFGGINALFSGLAFGGIIITILLQRKELALQRQELKESRAELKRTADAQEDSKKALQRQAANLKVSAQLSALNTLVRHYANFNGTFMENQDAQRLVDNYISKIRAIVDDKD